MAIHHFGSFNLISSSYGMSARFFLRLCHVSSFGTHLRYIWYESTLSAESPSYELSLTRYLDFLELVKCWLLIKKVK